MSRALFTLSPLLVALAFCAAAHAADPVAGGNGTAMQGKIEGNTITSSAFPPGRITLDKAFTYVGATSFVLYGVADCEIHVFADITDNKVRRFYWVQFEGYLPSRPSSTYNYGRDPQDTMIGGHAFHRRSWASNIEEGRKRGRPGSDSEAVLTLLEGKGYVVGPDTMNVRLVRLDEAKRKELMIIYSENLAARGLKAADLADGGSAADQRTELFAGLRDRALSGIVMDMK
jgi:hypothetical protein